MAVVKTYSISQDVLSEKVNLKNLSLQIETSELVNGFSGCSRNGDELEILGDSIVSESGLDEIVFNHDEETLSQMKLRRYNEVDKKTGELIVAGFTYLGELFSMSYNAQINLLGLNSSKDDLTYPIKYNAKDDSTHILLNNASEVSSMYLSALADKKSKQDSGTDLKISIESASTKSEVEAIIDNR